MIIGVSGLFVAMMLFGAGFAEDTSSVAPATNTSICDKRTCSKLEYYDKLKQKCRDFPGGGFLVIMDNSAKCAHGDSGLHTFNRRDFYYVCHPDGVMIGVCPDSTVFSDTEKRCIVQSPSQPHTIKVHDEAQNGNIIVPDCSAVGLFPIPSNCSFYFKCQEHNYNFHQYVYQCPQGTFFHPDLQKCSSTNKCYEAHEDILHSFNKDYFPECHMYGQFRTAKDCALYYRCVPNIDGSFYQIRYECPFNMYYNIEKEFCIPEHFQTCDYIPHERILQNYRQKHDLEIGSTVNPQSTTIISAINTMISTCIPSYNETTESLVQAPEPTTESMSIEVEETKYKFNEQYWTTDASVEYTETEVEADTYETSTKEIRSRPRTDIDIMEWDDDAWNVPSRSRTSKNTSTTEQTISYEGDDPVTTTIDDEYITTSYTECPDHFPTIDSASDPQYSSSYFDPEEGSVCELLSCKVETSEAGEINRVTDQTSYIEPTTDETTTRDDRNDTKIAGNQEAAVEVSCFTDNDGEIVCNGGNLSVNGYMELLGYAFKFKKWAELSNEPPSTVPRTTFNFHISLEYPFNYVFEAHAIEYQSSYSWDHSSTTTEGMLPKK